MCCGPRPKFPEFKLNRFAAFTTTAGRARDDRSLCSRLSLATLAITIRGVCDGGQLRSRLRRTLLASAVGDTCRGSVILVGAMLCGCAAAGSLSSHVESELVIDATLVREDTSPDPRGRFGFARGHDWILVITRITSAGRQSSDRLGHSPDDRYVERLWLTIPRDAPLGSQLDLAQLSELIGVGYDRNDRQRGFFISPIRCSGRVRILAHREQQAVVYIDVQVAPVGFELWRLSQVMTVPVTTDGIRASGVQEQDFRNSWFRSNPIGQSVSTSLPMPTESQVDAAGSDGIGTVADAAESGGFVQIRPKAGSGPEGQSSEALPDRSITGQWLGQTPAHPDKPHYLGKIIMK